MAHGVPCICNDGHFVCYLSAAGWLAGTEQIPSDAVCRSAGGTPVGAAADCAPGRLLMKLVGHPLAFSFEGLVVGSVIYSFPFAVQPIAAGFAAIDGDVIDTARLLGAQGAELLFRILVPLAKRSLLAAAVLSFAHTVGEFGVVLMLGGGIPGRTRTLSIAIYDQVQVFDYVSANRTSLLLIVVSFVSLCFLYGRRRNVYA